MDLNFYKYQGTGNDFVVIDNRQPQISKNDTKLISRLCDRKFGVGADGLMLLENTDQEGVDFRMVYFNADGIEGSMCGNGGRCLVAFAQFLGIIKDKTTFVAVDGLHYAMLKDGLVHLQMQDVFKIEQYDSHSFLDTGSPHHVALVDNLVNCNVYEKGKAIRYGAPYYENGSNVNFVEQKSDGIFAVRTYERGVEDETLSCGTGVTAVALSMHASERTGKEEVAVKTPGGLLKVTFKKTAEGYKDIFLIGPAEQVFKGTISW